MRWPVRRLPARALPAGPGPVPAVPTRTRHLGLQGRFLAIVLAGALIFSLLAGVVVYRFGYARAIDVGREEIKALLDAVGKTAAIGAYAGDRVLVQEILEGIAGNPLIARAEVTDDKGESLGQAGRGIATRGLPTIVEHPLISPFDAREQVGHLRAAIDKSQLERNARATASLLAAAMVGQTALVALLLYLAAAALVSRPIVRLADTLRNLAPGTLETLPIPPRHRHDEIGTLIASANSLLGANAGALQRERDLRAAIERLEVQYRQIFDASSAGIFVLDGEGRLINGNPTVMRMIGRPVEAIRSLHRDEFIATVFARPDRVRELIADATDRRETVSADLELLHADRMTRWVHCLISVQGRQTPQRLVEGVMYDVTERKRLEAEVRHRAEHDGLTGLMNRTSLDAALDRWLDAAGTAHRALSVLYLDLDGFKRINDAFGHKAGDRVLIECARRLRTIAPIEGSLVARIGGDEFVVVLDAVGPDDPALIAIATRLIAELQQPIELDPERRVEVGASVGIACFPRHGGVRRGLLQAADAAMYEVKRSGRNAVATAFEGPATT